MLPEAVILDAPPRQERRYRMSYTDYEQWADEDTHAEWVNGEVTVFMPPLIIHQHIAGFLYSFISLFAKFRNAGQVLIAPCEVRMIPDRSYREPDIFFVSRDRLHLLSKRRMEAAPDLIVELVSQESVRRDYHEKFAEYAQYGVREYWIIDPRAGQERATFYQRSPDGGYRDGPPDGEGRYHSAVLDGLWLRPAWLWQEPLPAADDVMLEVFGDTYIQHLQQRQAQRNQG